MNIQFFTHIMDAKEGQRSHLCKMEITPELDIQNKIYEIRDSSAFSLSVRSLCVRAYCRMNTKVLIIAMFTSIAISLLRTLESIETPCSVNE